jgi:hypothetical protein
MLAKATITKIDKQHPYMGGKRSRVQTPSTDERDSSHNVNILGELSIQFNGCAKIVSEIVYGKS